MPDNDALQFGKEFGNRGQCNPTYFTVGNLVKYLDRPARREGMPTRRSSSRTTCSSRPARAARAASAPTSPSTARRCATPASTASACCCSSRQGGLKQATGEGVGPRDEPDVLLARRRRRSWPATCSTRSATASARTRSSRARPTARSRTCKQIICDAFDERRSVARSRCCKVPPRARRGRRSTARSRSRKVGIIGEFWAMTTEGDGNYRLQRFLESEGAEVDIQPSPPGCST